MLEQKGFESVVIKSTNQNINRAKAHKEREYKMNKSIFEKFVSATTVAMVLCFAIGASAQTQNSGWPSDSWLDDLGLSGMPAPAGATNILHGDNGEEAHHPSNSIVFQHSNAATASETIRNWLVRNGWERQNHPFAAGVVFYEKSIQHHGEMLPTYVSIYINGTTVTIDIRWNIPM